MRIERTGPIEPLTEPVFRFLEEELGGVSLDKDGDRFSRPDYVCLRGLLVVEVKTLEGAPKERLDNAIRPETKRGDRPRFFGSWPVSSVLKNLSGREALEKRLNERLGRPIRTHINKANDQIRSHCARERRGDRVRLLVLVNEDHEEYTPDVIRFVAGHELWHVDESGSRRNGDIDAIIYLSHRHAAAIDGQVTFPIAVIEGWNLGFTPWKRQVLDLAIRRWCRRNNAPLKEGVAIGFDTFEAVEHVPPRMKRHELWALEYRRRPYMRNWKDEDLRNLWDLTMLQSILAFVKGCPMQVPAAGVTETNELFTHLMQEVGQRGLPLSYFKPKPERLCRAIDSLPYGDDVRQWLRSELKHLLA